ncbi:hypothetical protein HZH66_004123 [Vespula vulgaris]|uniref:Uncharacterized protein n=1 Tax=Vespula vulgaris TaxID=7454 RepID=A0A834KEL0_VESVU|nr:hypothetical protein HZH66_004123 [Vespula vulgaris]
MSWAGRPTSSLSFLSSMKLVNRTVPAQASTGYDKENNKSMRRHGSMNMDMDMGMDMDMDMDMSMGMYGHGHAYGYGYLYVDIVATAVDSAAEAAVNEKCANERITLTVHNVS